MSAISQRGGGPSADEPRFLDMATIRRRVARIKNGWSPELARARAIEGERRREALALLLDELAAQDDAWETPENDFSLVG